MTRNYNGKQGVSFLIQISKICYFPEYIKFILRSIKVDFSQNRHISYLVYQLMKQGASCYCKTKFRIKEAVFSAIKQIRVEYTNKINELNKLLTERQAKIVELYHLVNQKEAKLNENEQKWKEKQSLLDNALISRDEEIINLKQEMDKRINEYESSQQTLKKSLILKENEVIELKKQFNFDAFSSSMSSISVKQRSNVKTYSFDFTQYFQSYPETTLKLLYSLPEEKPTDEKEKGDMMCMFISRDDLSVEKYGSVSRSFLRHKIKQEQKRFRFVIIYKPDKQ